MFVFVVVVGGWWLVMLMNGGGEQQKTNLGVCGQALVSKEIEEQVKGSRARTECCYDPTGMIHC